MTGLAERALAVLRRNDTGLFVAPSQRVYPFQWNWDAALIALGLAWVDPERGRAEVRSLLRGRWADGLLPHIVFHRPAAKRPVRRRRTSGGGSGEPGGSPDGLAASYSPGPELWGSSACPGAPAVPTSGITQPPVLATAIRTLHEAAPDQAFLEDVLPAVEAWHRWLHRERRLDGSGLVAILHPWESADDSPRFDDALARIDGGVAVERSDRDHIDAAERPSNDEYSRYLALVERLRKICYRPASLDEAPFAYVDPAFNAVFAVAESDLAELWSEIGGPSERARNGAARLRVGLAACWDDQAVAYRGRDLHGSDAPAETFADLMPLYAGVADERRARRLFDESLWAPDRFGPSPDAPWAVTSASKSSRAYDGRRYWRGPVWVNVNWFLIRGLERSGLRDEAAELRRLTLGLVERSGFSEYYDPATGAPLGARGFSWTAALTLDLLLRPA